MGKIMEINVNSTTVSEVLGRVKDFISDSEKFYIVTPNPELILMAQKNKKLKIALNEADMSVPDGVGLKIANPSLNIIKGRELCDSLIRLASQKGWKVFFLGGLDNEAQLAAQKLQIINNKAEIDFAPGPKLNSNAKPSSKKDVEIEKQVIERINKFAPQLLFVAFGNPRQEIWINEHLSDLNIGGAMCVGGTLRYIAGISKLPPKWMASCGLEWLWRLITEPYRAGRVLNAVIVFPVKALLSKLRS